MSDLAALLEPIRSASSGVIILTGAGVSAESGIPTFRGREGYWTVGSREYHPQELATHAAFSRMPLEVWAWYLYRRGVCRAAAPNPAHAAIVAIERALGDRAVLITQNVDGLHLRAGSTQARTYEIHGNIDYMRCADDCCTDRFPLPDGAVLERGAPVTDELEAMLVCPRCSFRTRPHVLWFDERYDEPRYRWDSSLRAAGTAGLVVVAGTSAQTNLPWQVVETAVGAGATIIDVNVEDNPFAEVATRHGIALRMPASQGLGAIAAILAG